MVIVFFVVLFGCITGAIASSKGRSFILWWFFGAMLFIVALPAVLIVSNRRYRCDYCDERISKRASVCPHCRSQLA